MPGAPLFPLRPKAGSSGTIPAILVPALSSPPTPGAIIDDDDGTGWGLLQAATMAVVVAAAVATTSRVSLAEQLQHTAWQDELPASAFGAVGGVPLDLWATSSTRPRLVSFGVDVEIVPQPAAPALDDGSEVPTQWVVRSRPALDLAQLQDEIPRITVDEDYALALDVPRPRLAFALEATDEAILAQAAATISVDEFYWLAPDPAVRVLAFPPAPETDAIVAQPAPLGIDDSDWTSPFFIAPASVWMPVPWQFGGGEGSVWGPIDEDYALELAPPRRALPCLGDTWSDDAIVPQPVPLHVDEMYWLGEPGCATVARGPLVFLDNPEIVPQPVPFRLEEGSWEPPFVVAAVRWLAVSQLQDEVVPTLHVDEMAPDPWLLLPAKRIIAFPDPPDDWPALFGVIPEIAAARLACFPVFSASLGTAATTAALDTASTFTAALDIEPEPE